uniref:Junctional adhesion molecule 2b n=1 Tax=Oncorhynchus tshawytscha TaxID=74940 RepID=A0AAZ3Q1C8_ONCTS
MEVHENTDAVLSCQFKTEKETNPRIEWKKKGKDIHFVYFDGKFTGSFAGRAKIEGATVTLHAVTQKDSGLYRCEVSAPADHTNLGEVNVTLNVLVPPHTPFCEVPSSVLSGASVELHCKDKLSVPPPTFLWYKDNKALSATHTPDIVYSMDTDTGTLVSNTKWRCFRCLIKGMLHHTIHPPSLITPSLLPLSSRCLSSLCPHSVLTLSLLPLSSPCLSSLCPPSVLTPSLLPLSSPCLSSLCPPSVLTLSLLPLSSPCLSSLCPPSVLTLSLLPLSPSCLSSLCPHPVSPPSVLTLSLLSLSSLCLSSLCHHPVSPPSVLTPSLLPLSSLCPHPVSPPSVITLSLLPLSSPCLS